MRTVTPLMRRACAIGVLAALLPVAAVSAAGGGSGGGGGTQPGPSSQGIGAVTNGKLVAGAGGTYLPIIPTDITPARTETRNPLQVPPPGPNPQGMICPEANLFHVRPGSPSPEAR